MSKSKAAPIDLLNELHSLTAKCLIEKLKSEETTASDIRNALAMLKDNNIQCDVVDDTGKPTEVGLLADLEIEEQDMNTNIRFA